MAKEDGCNPAITGELHSAPESLSTKLVGKGLDCTLPFTNFSLGVCNAIVDVLLLLECRNSGGYMF